MKCDYETNCFLKPNAAFDNMPRRHSCTDWKAACHNRCGTIKIPPCSMALSAEHRPKFCSPSPVMVMSPYKWNTLERDVKQEIINLVTIAQIIGKICYNYSKVYIVSNDRRQLLFISLQHLTFWRRCILLWMILWHSYAQQYFFFFTNMPESNIINISE
jgi:hypothetical protein